MIKMNKNLIIFIGIAVFIITVALIYPYILHGNYETLEEKAWFGDSYGMLNTIFSGLAFAGLIMAILIQRDELKVQTDQLIKQGEELAMQKEELTLQREEMTETRKEFKMQRATNIIYKQLERFDEEVSRFQINHSPPKPNMIIGPAALLSLNIRLNIKSTNNGTIYKGMDEARRVWLINQTGTIVKDTQTLRVLTSGLRATINTVIKTVDDSAFNNDEKLKLINLFYDNINSLYVLRLKLFIKA